MAWPMAEVVLTVQENNQLVEWTRRHKTSQALALRSRIVLACSQGIANDDVARRLGVNHKTVGKWRRRFVERRLDGLLDEPRPGAPRKLDDARIEHLIATTLNECPRGATHWSIRSMAAKVGVSRSTVNRVWRAFGLQPHRSETFKLSTDPLFIDKVRDIVGLYMSPPANAVVLSVDEKSQIQALDRTQPGLPMKKGRAGTMTHDYKRHGVTTLFAALDVLEGKVIGQCMKRHRHQEFIRFLNVIEARVSRKKTIHVIVDNYATHKHPDVMAWLEKHRRFVFHFTPTSASWLNAIEGFFAKLTKKRLKHGVFRSLRELKDAIHRFLDHTNANPKPFTWTKDPNKIIAAVRRGHQVLDSIH